MIWKLLAVTVLVLVLIFTYEQQTVLIRCLSLKNICNGKLHLRLLSITQSLSLGQFHAE